MNGRQFPSNLLGESFQSKCLEASLHCIFGSHKIELSSIIQQTSSEFVVYESFTPILGANEACKRVWIQTGYTLGPLHWASAFRGEASRAGGEACACTLAFAAAVVLGGPLGYRGLHTFFAWRQFLTKWSGLWQTKQHFCCCSSTWMALAILIVSPHSPSFASPRKSGM